MSNRIKIKDVVFADDSNYKTQKISVSNKSILTPLKAIDLGKNVSGITTSNSVKGINELYKIFTTKSIGNLRTTSREEEVNNIISRLFKKYSSEDEINICFTEFDELKFPDEQELEYLTNLSYVHSDITPLPLLPKITKTITSDTINDYLKFIEETIDSIEIHNHKPIMGIIPMKTPSVFLPALLQTYLNKGVTSLCLDFQGSTVVSSLTKIRALIKSMKKQRLLENSFIYSLNLGAGKLPKDKEVVPAKDILSFGYGFDAIGGQHVRKKLSPEVRAKILSARNIFENSLRLFNKEDYGYYRATKKETVEKIYPEGSCIPLNLLEIAKKRPNVDKLFNQEQQGLEAINLRVVIKEQHELLKYLNKKEYVEKSDIKTLENIKQKS